MASSLVRDGVGTDGLLHRFTRNAGDHMQFSICGDHGLERTQWSEEAKAKAIAEGRVCAACRRRDRIFRALQPL